MAFDFYKPIFDCVPQVKLVKRWFCVSIYHFFDARSFKDYKKALEFFRKHDGYFIQKLETFE